MVSHFQWWILSPSTAVEHCFFKKQHSRNCQCCWSTCNFPIWRLVNLDYFKNIQTFQLYTNWSLKDNFFNRQLPPKIRRLAICIVFPEKTGHPSGSGPVGVRRLQLQSGAYGSSVAVAFLCWNIRSKNLVDIAWLQLLIVETCVLWPYANQTYMKCLLGFEHKD